MTLCITYCQYDLCEKQVIGGGVLYKVPFETTDKDGVFENVSQIDLQVQDIPHPSRINIYLHQPGEQRYIGFVTEEISSGILTVYIRARNFLLYSVKG